MPPLLAIFDATGPQGGGVVRSALADPQRRFRVRAVTRTPGSARALALRAAGAEVVAADLDDPASVERAMHGAQAAFCLTDSWEHRSPQREISQARALATGAARAGVRHVVWSTLEDTRELVSPGTLGMRVLAGGYNVPHFDAKGEANSAFIASGVPTTLLYAAFQWDDLLRFGMQPHRAADGSLAFVLPMGEATLPGIATEDIGPCAFGIFARGDDLVGRSIGIAGEHLNGAQMAELFALALGEPVRHVAVSPEAFAALGLPAADELANLFRYARDFERHHCASRSVACARELHPGTRTFAGWLATNVASLSVAQRPAGSRGRATRAGR
jgi:uncharacterized protein YbjT (DUF2867 family)